MKQGIITITRTGAVRRAVRPDLASPSYLNAYRAYPLPRIKPCTSPFFRSPVSWVCSFTDTESTTPLSLAAYLLDTADDLDLETQSLNR